MGIHTNVIKRSKKVRVFGLRLLESDDFIDIAFAPFGPPWPVLAKKLDDHGLLNRIGLQAGKITLKTSTQIPFLRALVQGHGKKSRLPKFLLLAASMTVIAAVVMVPLGVESEQTLVVKKSSPINQCESSRLTKWLEGESDEVEIKPIDTSILGGVTVGILECSGSRYSYTLGSGDTKRVLKLQKLDP